MSATKLNHTEIVQIIKRNLGHALDEGYQKEFTWYMCAHIEGRKIAREYNTSVEIAITVIAVLSPGLSWDVNVQAARDCFEGKIPQGAYGANVRKAYAIIQTGDVSILKGMKVTSFKGNIFNPFDTEVVTIDRWAKRIATNDWKTTKVEKSEYWKIAAAYREVAAEYGMLPNQVQAITWCWAREKKGRNPQ